MSGSWLQKTLGKPVVWPPWVERLVRQGIPIQQGHLKGARCQRTQPVLQPDVKKASRKKKKRHQECHLLSFKSKEFQQLGPSNQRHRGVCIWVVLSLQSMLTTECICSKTWTRARDRRAGSRETWLGFLAWLHSSRENPLPRWSAPLRGRVGTRSPRCLLAQPILVSWF